MAGDKRRDEGGGVSGVVRRVVKGSCTGVGLTGVEQV